MQQKNVKMTLFQTRSIKDSILHKCFFRFGKQAPDKMQARIPFKIL